MKNTIFIKKWIVTCKTAVKSHFMTNLWKLEDQYRIIFHQALWLEKPWEIHLFEKSFEKFGPDVHGICEKYPKWSQNGDLGVWIPASVSKLRSESIGDAPGPQKPFFCCRTRVEIRILGRRHGRSLIFLALCCPMFSNFRFQIRFVDEFTSLGFYI